ncbi:MAG: hypothetical protein ACW97P_03580 [Candidatus Hodarchaeales archaeon]|jgi:hypothetical protein
MAKTSKKSVKTKLKTEKVVRRSAADFFQDNKAIAGFDNSMRVVFTSVRELDNYQKYMLKFRNLRKKPLPNFSM